MCEAEKTREDFQVLFDAVAKKTPQAIELCMKVLEDNGPGQIYTIMRSAVQASHDAGLMLLVSTRAAIDASFQACGTYVLASELMKVYEAKHGPVDWVTVMHEAYISNSTKNAEREKQAETNEQTAGV